jgi:hypothetical protein
MHKHSFEWMVNRVFYETVGCKYDSIAAAIIDRWIGEDDPPLKRVERSLSKVHIIASLLADGGADRISPSADNASLQSIMV